MKVTNKIKIYLDDNRGPQQSVNVMQGDAYTRELEFFLYSGSVAWNVPEGVSVAVAYHGPSGHGIYDTLPDGSKGYSVSGNVVTVTLIPQVAAVAGRTMVTVLFTDENGKQLATFGVIVQVAQNPAIGAGKPENYFNIREWIGAGPLWVTFTSDGAGGYTVDKTHAQIYEAHKGGRAVYCIAEPFVLPLVAISNASALFEGINNQEYTRVLVKADGTVSMSMGRFALHSELPKEFRVAVSQADGAYAADAAVADIVAAYNAKRPVSCLLTLEDDVIRLPLTHPSADKAVFSGIYESHIYTVTITADSVTVEVDANAVTGVVLKDQVTGETYTLYMDDADLHIVAGGKAAAARDNVLLADSASGENYVIYVSDGALMLESEV